MNTLARVALVAALTLAACTKAPVPPPVADAGVAPVVALKRPPYPNLATAAYGQRVLEERNAAVPPGTVATLPEVLAALHEIGAGTERRAVELAFAAARGARTEQERATALALAAAALVLDPVVDGYQERLTDAFGLAAYAATLDQTDSLAQAARALVGAAAGAVAQAQSLLKGIAEAPVAGAVSADVRLLCALARRVVGERGDTLVAELRAVLKATTQSQRARALLAEQLLELGLYVEAREAAGAPPTAPWLAAIAARAQVLGGELDAGVAALRDVEGKVDEARRGDVLYWLARSLTQKADGAAEVQGIASALAPRPGFAKESQVLLALLAQQGGDYGKARTLVEPLVQGRPRLPVDIDALWLLVDACAGQGELPCVEKAGALALEVDGDEARVQVARAAAVLVGKAGSAAPDAVLATFREAHRLAPFDDKLADKVGEPVVAGGAAAATRVRAARRALARGDAAGLVEEALAPVKDPTCRVCRALAAAAASEPQEAARRALKALDGGGPALAESDLVRTIEALGAFPIDGVRPALAKLDADARPRVQQALARARRSARGAPMSRTLLLLALLGAVAAPPLRAHDGTGAAAERRKERDAAHQRALKAFTPFDGGDARDVVRQGKKGKKRAAHPMVGDAAKVPGEGPPPPPLRTSPDVPESALLAPNTVGVGLSSSPLLLASLGYQHVFTKLDGPRCAHLPTCSRFGAQAVARHGALGIVMTLDRLIQPNDSSAIRHLPEVEGFGMVRVFDPVDDYEIWKTERFTGFLLPAAEVPLVLPPLLAQPLASLSTPVAEIASP